MSRTHQDIQTAKDTERLLGHLRTAEGGPRQRLENELVAQHLSVARDVARRYHGRGIPADDLNQVAYLGMVKAARGYDHAKGDGFLAYAVPTVRGELRRHFRDHGWTVRPPRSVQELQPRVVRARERLAQQLGRDPRTDEVAEHLGVEVDQVLDAGCADGCFTPTSLDAAPDDDSSSVVDRLGSADPGFPQAEARVALRPLLRQLSAREQRILEMRFCEGCTQAEIGDEIGVSQVQVSRLLTGVFERLRGQLVGASA
ncbi:SigB/SigF/SigG family RNA polymerase sigma factor [Nocardioides sp. GXQ0305]|uniref:SigB/SigF/SigG family RNA polymerase sigma factor n=1 Tax=Nocardioides sp. GXQ0305 TaxID=3423912 RepID=UPI003D7E97B1